MRRPLGLLAPAAVAAALFAGVGPFAAVAGERDPAPAEGGLEVSRDGSHWGDTFREPLFDPQITWVPGDVRAATFFVRSGTAVAGALTVDLVRGERDASRDTGHLAVEARAGGDWTGVDGKRLVEVGELAGGRPVPVELRIRLDPQAPNQAMVLATDVDLRVSTDEVAVADAPTTRTDHRTALLPATGSDMSAWFPPLGLLLAGAGAYLVARRRAPRRVFLPARRRDRTSG